MESEFPDGLDVLVNNAGVAIAHGAKNKFEEFAGVYAVNVFGGAALAEALFPSIKKAQKAHGKGQVVFLSSELGSLGNLSDPSSKFYPVNIPIYNSSKAAVNMLALSYSKMLKEEGIMVNAYDPGYVATNMNRNQGTGTPEEGVRRLAGEILNGTKDTGTYWSWEDNVLPW
jgi:NAD(P)-dependent dehydrogenase (short-subunit alcohol dehydrogenase family)